MPTELPLLQAPQLFGKKDYRDVLMREMDAGKIPLSLGKDCPVKCEFCYELDHSYRETLDPPKRLKMIGSLFWSTSTRNPLIHCSFGV